MFARKGFSLGGDCSMISSNFDFGVALQPDGNFTRKLMSNGLCIMESSV